MVESSAVSKMLLELGDPIGPEITFPPLALASSAGCIGGFETGDAPLTVALRLEGMLAAGLSSFLGIVWVRFALSRESPRFGKFCRSEVAGNCACLGDSSVIAGLESSETVGVAKPGSEGEFTSAVAGVLDNANCSIGSVGRSARGVDASDREFGVELETFFRGASWSLNLSVDADSLVRAVCCERRGDSCECRDLCARMEDEVRCEPDLLTSPPDRFFSVTSREGRRPFSW